MLFALLFVAVAVWVLVANVRDPGPREPMSERAQRLLLAAGLAIMLVVVVLVDGW
jgi:hypothetical protein